MTLPFSRIFYLITGCGLIITTLMMGLYVFQPHFLRQLDLKVYDQFLFGLDPGQPSSRPLILDIDEASLARYGQWPWPRYRLAALVDRLGQGGVSAVGLDILLAEPDRTSPILLRSQLHEDFGLDITFNGLPAEIEDNDLVFAQVLGQNPAILGCYFRFGSEGAGNQDTLAGPGIAELQEPDAQPALSVLPVATSVSLPLPVFTTQAPAAFFNVSADQDGLVRRVPLLLGYQGEIHASLALRTLMLAHGETTLILHSGPDGIQSVQCGSLTLPLAPDGTMPVLFRGPAGVYQVVSALDVLEGRVPAETLQGRIAFVGASAPGLRDIRSTPFDRHFPGVETHAAVVDAVLSGRFLIIPPWTPGVQILAILLTGLGCTALFGRCRSAVSLPVGGLFAWSLWQGGQMLFARGMFVSPLYPLLTVPLAGLTLMALRFWHEERQKKVIHLAFSRYVSPDVVNRIVATGKADTALAGESRELSILFSDIRGFTSLSERLSPAQVVSLLNRYFTPMTNLVRSSQGTVDKFIGDALMAFWNAPLDVDDHAGRAIHAALAMHDALATLNQELAQEHGLTLAIGVGVHTGQVYVGNMGTTEVLAYTAIGDNVNLASRLESLCPVYGVTAIASDATRQRCLDRFGWQRLDRVRVKGKAQPVEIFRPMSLGLARAQEQELLEHNRALISWDQGNFGQAKDIFQVLAASWPCTLYELYVRRCESLCQAPPVDWDGVWTFTTK